MAIRRLRRNPRRRRSGTMLANPRRRRRNPRRARARRRNPRRATAGTKKHMRRKTARRAYMAGRRRNPARKRSYARRRNQADMTFVGIPVLPAALGGLGALVVINAAKNIGFVKTQLKKIENPTLRAAVPPALAAAAGWALHKYGKGKMVKDVAKFIVAASLFKLIDDVTDKYFAEEFVKMFNKDDTPGDTPGLYGAYIPTYGRNTRGAYLPVDSGTGGAYVPVSGTRSHGTFGLL